MTTDVDLSQLAIDRGGGPPTRSGGGRFWSRYALPGALLAGFLALVGWAAWDYVFPPRDVTVVPVLATRAAQQRAGTSLFNAAGWVEPRPTPIRVAALAPGVVEQLLVVEDQPVKAGQAVAELVKDDAQLALQRAEADQRLRKAELEQARAAQQAATTRLEQPVHLEAPLGEAEAALARIDTELDNLPFATRRAESRLKLAEEDLRGKKASPGVVSGVELDRARSEVETAQALVEELKQRAASLNAQRSALRQRRDALQTQLELLADEKRDHEEAAALVAAATARLEQADVAAAEARLRLDRMTVRAPVAGRVYKLVGHPGTQVGAATAMAAGQDSNTVVTLYQPGRLQVRVDVRFADLPNVAPEQPVRIANPALDEPLRGEVLFKSSIADIQKNTLEVKVAIDDPPADFKPEMLVDVTFLAPQQAGAGETAPSEELRLFVPERLVRSGEDGRYVWVADQSSGTARRTPVEVGVAGADGMIEVTRGLTPASRLIAEEHQGLSDGERIRVTGEAGAPEGGSR